MFELAHDPLPGGGTLCRLGRLLSYESSHRMYCSIKPATDLLNKADKPQDRSCFFIASQLCSCCGRVQVAHPADVAQRVAHGELDPVTLAPFDWSGGRPQVRRVFLEQGLEICQAGDDSLSRGTNKRDCLLLRWPRAFELGTCVGRSVECAGQTCCCAAFAI